MNFNVEITDNWLLILMITCQGTGKCSLRPCLPREPPKTKSRLKFSSRMIPMSDVIVEPIMYTRFTLQWGMTGCLLFNQFWAAWKDKENDRLCYLMWCYRHRRATAANCLNWSCVMMTWRVHHQYSWYRIIIMASERLTKSICGAILHFLYSQTH